jgi:DNA-binding response OmpR family regulator
MRVDDHILRAGPLALDLEGFAVTVDGEDLPVTYGEFLILEEFVRHPFQVLNRQRLTELVRRGAPRSSPTNPENRAVDTHIARLRAKLRALGYDCIRTMRNVGYRFVPPAGDEPPNSSKKARATRNS